jgi:hypothetical protein
MQDRKLFLGNDGFYAHVIFLCGASEETTVGSSDFGKGGGGGTAIDLVGVLHNRYCSQFSLFGNVHASKGDL